MNYGKKVTEIKTVNFSQALALITMLRKTGQVFRVDFTKKSDGSDRTMVCRLGVKSKTSGKGARYSFSDKGLLSVYEFGKGYRAIPLDNIEGIKVGGVWYNFESINSVIPSGVYVGSNHPTRTIPASTSPLLAV